MFISRLFIIGKKQIQTTFFMTGELWSKLWYALQMENQANVTNNN